MTNTKLPRRTFLHLAAGAAVLPAVSWSALAQAYPSRPVSIIVGFPVGSAADILARLLGQRLSERLGQPFIIENRAGAGSNVATEAVVRAAPDGYTLLMVTGSNAVNATLYDKLSYNFIQDIAPVVRITRGPLVMVVNPSVPTQSVAEFIAYAQANPGKLNMASSGNGGTTHVVGELLKIIAGVDIRHVPYRGSSPALADLLVGKAHVMFDLVPPLMEPIKTGKLRALAVTTEQRSDALPDTPSLSDFVPGYEAAFWGGIGAPKETPVEIINELNTEINAALLDPAITKRVADVGYTAFASSPADFGKFIATETEKWAKVVKAAGLNPD
jgi:tripartite-type tricarboxylate transporter receptor subunit TctC